MQREQQPVSREEIEAIREDLTDIRAANSQSRWDDLRDLRCDFEGGAVETATTLLRALDAATAREQALREENTLLRERQADLNNKWRHEFSAEVEAATDKLFKRMAWPHAEMSRAALSSTQEGE